MALVILCLTPFLIALAVPAALAWRGAVQTAPATRRSWTFPLAAGFAVALVAAVAAALAGRAAGGPSAMGAGWSAALLVGAFGLMSAALYALARAADAPPAAGQCLAALAAVLLLATPFYMNPLIEGAGPEGRNVWLAFTAGANPFLALAHAAGVDDPLRSPILYKLSVCQYYTYAYAGPGALAGRYAAAAFAFGVAAAGAAWARRRTRRGKTAPQTP